MGQRQDIPADLTRALMIKAGYRCAIPACRSPAPLEIDHIIEYSKVRKHQFSNMIVLCRNCHGRKEDKGPRQLDRKALTIIKRHLGLVNQRYNDFERRILEYFVENPAAPYVVLPATEVLFGYLIKDGLIAGTPEMFMPNPFAQNILVWAQRPARPATPRRDRHLGLPQRTHLHHPTRQSPTVSHPVAAHR